MEKISSDRLDRLLHGNEEIYLINVLSREDFLKEHIPGSLNVPYEDDAFVQGIERIVPSKSSKIVVYCKNTMCSASDEAAKALSNNGFSYILRYEEGIDGWKSEGREVESGKKTHRRAA